MFSDPKIGVWMWTSPSAPKNPATKQMQPERQERGMLQHGSVLEAADPPSSACSNSSSVTLCLLELRAPQKLCESHWCVPFTATFSKRRKIGALWSERCDDQPRNFPFLRRNLNLHCMHWHTHTHTNTKKQHTLTHTKKKHTLTHTKKKTHTHTHTHTHTEAEGWNSKSPIFVTKEHEQAKNSCNSGFRINKQHQPGCRTLLPSECPMLLGRSPRKNCKNDLDDQTWRELE